MTFDLLNVLSTPTSYSGKFGLRLRMVKALDMLLVAALAGAEAPALILKGLQARPNRLVRFYDDEPRAREGTRSAPLDMNRFAGAASWQSITGGVDSLGQNAQDIPISERMNERILLSPRQNGLFPTVVVTTWHEMTHIFTTFNHGDWAVGGGFVDPGSAQNVSWHAFMQRLQAAAPVEEEDPLNPVGTDYIKNGVLWTCSCGVAHRA